MKKYLSYSLILFFAFLIITPSAKAENLTGMVYTADGRGINLRINAGTSYDTVGTGKSNGDEVTIVDTVNTVDGSTGCTSGKWYKISNPYGNNDSEYAYACTSFITLISDNPDTNFESVLITFPESYRPYLIELHNIYPNASFIAYNTGLNWSDILNNEIALGKNLIQDTNSTRDGLKNLDSYTYATDTFYNNYPGGGSTWYAASRDTIAYYMDPRNFLNSKRVFMFEKLSYDPDDATDAKNYTQNGVESVLYGSFMYSTYVDGGTSSTFASTIMEAGKTYHISPYYIASRILQETGTSRSALVKGTYPSYPQFNGYYNFFNYGAGGTNIVYNGLSYAYNNGWNSEYKAIVGGVSKIGTSYIGIGQDTNYLQKFDVICNVKTNTGSCYSNQYMQNVEAPYSESNTTYKSYSDTLGTNIYSASFVFSIPVYNNMPSSTSLPSSASPNNYLSRLVINGTSISNFSGDNTEYDFEVAAGTNSVTIEATALTASKGATVSGIGNINITSNNQTIPVTVTAANGATRVYKINVTRGKSNDSNLSDIKLNGATISEFDSSKQTYNITVDNSTSNVSLSASLSDNKATILTNLSQSIALDYGVNNIEIKVQAEDLSTKTYTLVITRISQDESNLSTNNSLSDIKLNGNTIANFNFSTQTYSIKVTDSTSSVLLSASLSDNKATILTNLSQSMALGYGVNSFEIKVEAENKSIKTYTLNIERIKGITYTVSNLKSGSISDNYITGLTNSDTIISAIKNANSAADIIITDLNGNVVKSGNMGTGYKVNVIANNDSKTFEAVIYGDTNGDGEITILDLLRVQKELLGSISLTGSQLKAMDVSKNGKVDILDLLKVRKHLLGSSYIEQ